MFKLIEAKGVEGNSSLCFVDLGCYAEKHSVIIYAAIFDQLVILSPLQDTFNMVNMMYVFDDASWHTRNLPWDNEQLPYPRKLFEWVWEWGIAVPVSVEYGTEHNAAFYVQNTPYTLTYDEESELSVQFGKLKGDHADGLVYYKNKWLRLGADFTCDSQLSGFIP